MSTETVTNAAAERLRLNWSNRHYYVTQADFSKDFDAALTTERRATVERIRQRLDWLPTWDRRSVPGGLHVNRNAVRAILEDAARG